MLLTMAFYSPSGQADSTDPPSSLTKAEQLLEEVNRRLQDLEDDKQHLDKLRADFLARLEKTSGLSREEAKELLLDETRRVFAQDLAKLIEQARPQYNTHDHPLTS